MRLTRRGRCVVAGLVVTFVWASFFGLQALNALVLSGAIAILGSWVVVRRADRPRLRRRPVEPDSAGEPRTVELAISVPPSLGARVIDAVPADVSITSPVVELPVTAGTASYTVVTGGRGVHTIGPATIELTDPFGLVAHATNTTDTTVMMTYPRIHRLSEADRGPEALLNGALTQDRHEFEQLREYRRGDAVRDIDWKSSAKRAADPLVVKEFVSETAAGNALIVATCETGGEDAMAVAAASLACHLLDQEVPVELRTADEHVVGASGEDQRRAILAALARTGGGPLERDERDSASILVEAEATGEVLVTMGGGRRRFGRMTESGTGVAATDGGWER